MVSSQQQLESRVGRLSQNRLGRGLDCTVGMACQAPRGLPEAPSSLGFSSCGELVISTLGAVTQSLSRVSAQAECGGSSRHAFAKGICKMTGPGVICIDRRNCSVPQQGIRAWDLEEVSLP